MTDTSPSTEDLCEAADNVVRAYPGSSAANALAALAARARSLAAEVARLECRFTDEFDARRAEVATLRTELSAAQAEVDAWRAFDGKHHGGVRAYVADMERSQRATVVAEHDLVAERDAALTARAEAEARLTQLRAALLPLPPLNPAGTDPVVSGYRIDHAQWFDVLAALDASTALGTRLLEEAREEGRRQGREHAAMAQAEVDMLRGVGCNEDGDGPCGVCIKCARNPTPAALTEAEARGAARERERLGVAEDDEIVMPPPKVLRTLKCISPERLAKQLARAKLEADSASLSTALTERDAWARAADGLVGFDSEPRHLEAAIGKLRTERDQARKELREFAADVLAACGTTIDGGAKVPVHEVAALRSSLDALMTWRAEMEAAVEGLLEWGMRFDGCAGPYQEAEDAARALLSRPPEASLARVRAEAVEWAWARWQAGCRDGSIPAGLDMADWLHDLASETRKADR